MVNVGTGLVAGGMASARESALDRGLRRRRLGLAERKLGLQQEQAEREAQQTQIERLQDAAEDITTNAVEIIRAGQQQGVPQRRLQRLGRAASRRILELAGSAEKVSQGSGALLAGTSLTKVRNALLGGATPGERGEAAAAQQLGQAEALESRGVAPRQARETAGVAVSELAEPVDASQVIESNARLAAALLQKGLEPDRIGGILRQQANALRDERVTAGLTAVLEALPESQDEFQRDKAQRELASLQPRIEALTAAGVPEDVANILVLGGGQAQVPLDRDKFTQKELADIRGTIQDSRDVKQAITTILPLINEDTVGLLPSLSEEAGGLLQQIPVVNSILNAIGQPLGLDKESVRTAQEARSAFRTRLGLLSRFISQKGGRLSNQDREFALQAIRVLQTTSDPDAARNALQDLVRFADLVEQNALNSLQSGQVTGEAPSDRRIVKPREGGGFVVTDEQGNVVTTIESLD